jgi:nicotinate phosphoribosyltransferase
MSKNRKYYDTNVSDIPFIEYTNIFVGNLTWINRGVHNSIATYDLVVREKPEHWGFYIFDGLERYVDYLLQFTFDDDALETLRQMGLINSPETEKFYKNFKFTGDVMALQEGTIFFAGEPIVRVVAPLGQANLLTALTLNSFGYPVRGLTKVARMNISAKGRMVSGMSTVRLPGFEQAVWNIRANYLLGHTHTVPFTPQTYRKFPELKPSGKFSANINHAFIKSFPTERDAFRYMFDVLQPNTGLFLVMIDTYGLRHGLEVFIEEAKKTQILEVKKFMISIDSGDVLEESRYVRKRLDEVGFNDMKIQVFSNLDEYKIEKLLAENAPIDFLVGSTESANITDNPKFEAVYKMAELCHSDGTVEQKAKLAVGKLSLPGRKQIFRVYDEEGKMIEDIIGLENENLGEPLLKPFMKDGKQVGIFTDLEGVRVRIEKEIKSLPEKYKAIHNPAEYPVRISASLQNLFDDIKKKHS